MIDRRAICVLALFLPAGLTSCGSGRPPESMARERPPQTAGDFNGIPLNAGRAQSISVNPTDRNDVVVAMAFGGLWQTRTGGTSWRHLDGLNEVLVSDVQHDATGRTLVATVSQSNHVDHRGGIWVSRDGGGTWTRSESGRVPAAATTPARGGAYGITRDPSNTARWYVGTDYGVATSADDGATWTHVAIDEARAADADGRQRAVRSILAFPGGAVLAMTRWGIFRSDEYGAEGTWRLVKADDFGFCEFTGWNKMDRSPFWPYAFILKDYQTLYLYELGRERWTTLSLPEGGGSRGPFVRVGKADMSGDYITIWIGQGVRALRVTRKRIGALRALTAEDWTITGRAHGLHDDTGDLGLDADLRPVIMGTDGGLFKPDPHRAGRWISAAPLGSGMNSYQVTDLSGVNTSRDGRVETAMHFTTQDNGVWGATAGSESYSNLDCCEGFVLEGPATGDSSATIAYGRVGSGFSGNRFSAPGLTAQRNVPDQSAGGGDFLRRDQNGSVLGSDAGLAFYLKPGYWIRLWYPPGMPPKIVVSSDNGATWRLRYELKLNVAGIFQRTKADYPASYMKAYLPVFTGANNPDGSQQIGLIRLYNLMKTRVTAVDAASVITLPSGGSLAMRATEFDWQAVFGVSPTDWRHVIAPDMVNGDIKVTRDGGRTWSTDYTLTRYVTNDGRLKLYDGNAYTTQVTHIAFDPYRDARILVGTRENGVICSADGGATWWYVTGTSGMLYVTGFQFRPDGSARASTYGRGLWELGPACANTSQLAGAGPAHSAAGSYGVLPADATNVNDLRHDRPLDPEERVEPPISDTEKPLLIARTSVPATGGAVLGEDHRVELVAYGFDLQRETLLSVDGRPQRVALATDTKTSTLRTSLVLAPTTGFGAHRIEVRQLSPEGERSATFELRKVTLDEHLGKPLEVRQEAKELSEQELGRYEERFPDEEVPLPDAPRTPPGGLP